MSEVLYRQFRPQTFEQVINQEAVKTTLRNAVSAGNPAHAYLFTGPRGVGKTSIARILAKAVNCEKPKSGDPCGKCDNCTAITGGHFLDLIEIDAASHTGVDNIREIIDHVRFAPSKGKYKVIVIDEVHMLSKGAFNALLKTLEEPPAHAIFILATTEITKVPATIISRTQRFDFRRLTQSDVAEQLKKVAEVQDRSVPDGVIRLIARASEGSMRDALSLLDQLLSFSEKTITLEEAEDILGYTQFSLFQELFTLLVAGKSSEVFQLIKRSAVAGRDMVQLNNGFLQYLDLVLSEKVQGGLSDTGLVAEDQKKLNEHASAVSLEDLIRMIDCFLLAASKIRYSPIPELPLELAAMDYMSAATAADEPQSKQPSMTGKEADKVKQASKSTAVDMQSLEQVNRKWGEVLTKVREYHHSLISSLKLGRLMSLKDNELSMVFPYRFHKEAVEQRRNKLIIEKVLEEVYGSSYRLICLLEHEVDNPPKATDGNNNILIDEAMKVFGISNQSS